MCDSMEYNLETSLTRAQGIKREKPSLSFIFPVLFLHFLVLSPNVSTLSILSPTPVSDPTGCKLRESVFRRTGGRMGVEFPLKVP